MARIFITGSADGLGLGTARELIREGHEVVLHARSSRRAAEIPESVTSLAIATVIGDISSAQETRALARQVNDIGRMDAVIHNAGAAHHSHVIRDDIEYLPHAMAMQCLDEALEVLLATDLGIECRVVDDVVAVGAARTCFEIGRS